jgi:O-antigen/teichoic acid export membrane protein
MLKKPSRIEQKYNRLFTGEAGDIFKGMATLLMGSGAAKLVGIVSIPLLTRLYSPEDFGVLSIFMSLISISIPVFTLRYVLAIPLPRRDEMAVNLLVLCSCILVCTGVVFSLILWVFGEQLLGLFSMQQLVPYWWLFVLGSIGASVYEMMSLWATRKRAYRAIAQTAALQSLFGSLTKIGLGLLLLKPLGLLIGQVVTFGSGTSYLWRRFRGDLNCNFQHVTLYRMGVLASKYWQFPLYRLPSQFLLAFSVQAPVMFAAALYDATTTGQLGLALMALAIPVSLIGRALGQAFYGEIAHLKKGSEIRIKQLTHTVQKRLLGIGVPAAVGIFFLGEPIFQFVFGKHWALAGTYASALAPFVLLQLTSAPLIQILNIYDSQKAFLVINGFRTVGLLGIYWACSFFSLEPIRFVQLLSIFLFIFYLLVSLHILDLVNKEAAKKTVR